MIHELFNVIIKHKAITAWNKAVITVIFKKDDGQMQRTTDRPEAERRA